MSAPDPPTATRKSARQQGKRSETPHEVPHVKTPPPPSPTKLEEPVNQSMASQVAASSSAKLTAHDIMGGTDSELSELSDLPSDQEGSDKEEASDAEAVPSVPPPKGKTSPRPVEQSSSGEGLKRHKRTVLSSSEDEAGDEAGVSEAEEADKVVEDRVTGKGKPMAKGTRPKPVAKVRATVPRRSPDRDVKKGSPVRATSPGGKEKRKPEVEKVVKVYTPDGRETAKQDDDQAPASPPAPPPITKPTKLSLYVKQPRDRRSEVSDSGDRSVKSEHERDTSTGNRKNRAEGKKRLSDQGRGSSPPLEASSLAKRKHERDERKYERDDEERRPRDRERETLPPPPTTGKRNKERRNDDEAYDDSDHGKRGREARGDEPRKGGKARLYPKDEAGEFDRPRALKSKPPRTDHDDSRRDEERRIRKEGKRRDLSEEGERSGDVRKRKGDAERKDRLVPEARKRRGEDGSDREDGKEHSSQDVQITGHVVKKKKKLQGDTLGDHTEARKKLAPADRPTKRQDPDSDVQITESRPSLQRRPQQVSKPTKRITELGGTPGIGARTAGDAKPRTPMDTAASSRRVVPQVKKPYDPLAGAFSSLPGIGPGPSSGASTPVNRKPLLKSEMAPAAELTEARERYQKKRIVLYAQQVQLNSMSSGQLIQEYESRPKPWRTAAGIPRDDVTGKHSVATVNAILRLRDEGYFDEPKESWSRNGSS